MNYSAELNFFIKTCNKSHLDVLIFEQGATPTQTNSAEYLFDAHSFLKNNFNSLQDKHLYKLTTDCDFNYMFLLLPDQLVKKVLFIGPFLYEKLSNAHVLEIGENFEVAPHQHQFLIELYHSLPVFPKDSPLFSMVNSLCESIWGTQSFTITDFLPQSNPFDMPFSKTLTNADPSNALIKKETIERRYAFENQLIRAVASGQLHMETAFTNAFSSDVFEKRTANPLQNAKNYSIITNTLLRKGAELGGVHPVYLNQVSTDYAFKIEALSSPQEVPSLMKEMFRAYCRLVRKHNLRQYTPVVQKTILLIDADLSNDLSTRTLAEHQGVSLGYLSAVFKKETGKTISEYVCSRRIDYAEYLLNSTNLQIQTIALHCGIMDVNYFSKLFKKYKGKTPTEFRRGDKLGD